MVCRVYALHAENPISINDMTKIKYTSKRQFLHFELAFGIELDPNPNI